MKKSVLEAIKQNRWRISFFDEEAHVVEKRLCFLKKQSEALRDENYSLCSHPSDSIVDEGGMVGSVCTCSICGKLVSVSG